MDLLLMFIFGACIGSFLCCQARRLHLRETKSKKKLGSRSVCLHCGYQLKWSDNLPIISWLALRGKCRKCHKKIGIAEFLAELGVACAFLALALGLRFGHTIPNLSILSPTPLFWVYFAILILLVCFLSFLAIYDGLYGELPMRFLTISIILAAVLLGLKTTLILANNPFTINLVWEPLTSVTILGGLYLVLYLVSKGKWVGDGDWLLGTALGLALGTPWLAFVTLLAANLLASIVMTPFALRRKTTKIYFGPFLVIAFIIAICI